MLRFIQIYLLPGAVFQSVMVGGGYGTGRETVQFFTQYGLGGGLLGQAVATVGAAVVFALSLEIARAYRVWDYRSFFRVLLGRFWFVYEVLALTLGVLVIAVIGAAAGGIMEEELGLPAWIGVIIILAAVAVLTFYGRDVVTRVLALWSVVLYGVFLAYLTLVIVGESEAMGAAFSTATVEPGWFTSGMQYVFYNITAIPLVLFAARAIETRRQAFVSGVVGAMIAMLPGVLLHISFAAAWPGIIEEALPVYMMLGMIGSGALTLAYIVMLFGTFIETGVGNVQGFLERVQSWRAETGRAELAPVFRAAIAVGVMVLAAVLSTIGVVDLIADGYGTLAWGFLFVYVLPLLTIGVWRIYQAPG